MAEIGKYVKENRATEISGRFKGKLSVWEKSRTLRGFWYEKLAE